MQLHGSAARTLRVVVAGGILLILGVAGVTVVRASMERALHALTIAEQLEHRIASDRLRTITSLAESAVGTVANWAIFERLAGQAARGAAFDGDDIASLQSDLSDLVWNSGDIVAARVLSVPDGRLVASAIRLSSGRVSTIDTFPGITETEWFQDAVTATPFVVHRDDISLRPTADGGYAEPYEPFLRAYTSVPDRSGAPRFIVSVVVPMGTALRALGQSFDPDQKHWVTNAGGQILAASEPGLAFSHLLAPPGETIGDRLAVVVPSGVRGRREALARTPDGERFYVYVDTVLAPHGARNQGFVIVTSGRDAGTLRLSVLWDVAPLLALLALFGAVATALVVLLLPVEPLPRSRFNGRHGRFGAFRVELVVGLSILLLGVAGIRMGIGVSRAKVASETASVAALVERELDRAIIASQDLAHALVFLPPRSRASEAAFLSATAPLLAARPDFAVQWAEGGDVSWNNPRGDLVQRVGRNLYEEFPELREVRYADVLIHGPLQINDTLWAVVVRRPVYLRVNTAGASTPQGVASAFLLLEPLKARLAASVGGNEIRLVLSNPTGKGASWVGATAGWGAAARNRDVPAQDLAITAFEGGLVAKVSVLPGVAGGGYTPLSFLLVILSALMGAAATRLFLDRRRAVREFRRDVDERLAFQEAVTANAGAAIVCGDRDGVFTYVNPAAEALLGYSAEELVGQQPAGIAHDPQEIAAAVAKLSGELGRTVTPLEVLTHGLRPGHSVTRLWTFVRKDGGRVPVALTVSGVWRPGEDAPQFLLGVAHDLSEPESLTRRLKESESQLRDLIDVAPVGVLLVEHDGRISLANGMAASYTGYGRDELLGLNVDELALTGPGKHRGLRASAASHAGIRAMAPGRIVRLLRKDGSALSVEITLTPIRETNATMATITDVSQRLEVEALLLYQAERLQRDRAAQDKNLAMAVEQMRMASATGLGTWTVASGGETMQWDQQMFRLVGWQPTPDGVVAVRDWLQIVDPNGRRAVEALLRADGSNTESATAEFDWIRAADGEHRTGRMTGSLRDVGGTLHVMGTLMDVTDTVRATQRAAESESLAAAALDAFPAAATVLLDVEGRVMFSSAGWRALLDHFGGTPEGMNPALEYRDRFVPVAVGDTAAKEFVRGLEAVLGGELEEISGEFWLSQGESQRLIHAQGRRLSAANRPMVVVVLEDVTDARHLQQQVDRAQRLDSLGTMAGGIAHDLNNALVPLMLNLGVLRALKGPPSAALVDSIEASAVRTSKMVKQLLSFAKGSIVGSQGPVALDQLISAELAPLFRPTLPVGINFEVEKGPKGGCVVLGDRDQLFQMMLNLCTNARDAIVGPGRISVRLRRETVAAGAAVEPGEYWVTEVTDSGKGIPASQLERIFDPFFTTKEASKGTGLGLSTTLGIVRRHGGMIQVDSVEGRGSTFRVYLRAHAEEPTAEAPSGEPASAPDPLVRSDGTVLVVDDDDGVRTALSAILTRLGYRAVAASDGVRALSMVTILGGQIRAIVTDINMPNMDGLQFARAVRIVLPDVPILVVTGSPAEEVKSEAAALGLKHFLTKPFTQRQLTAKLQQAMRR